MGWGKQSQRGREESDQKRPWVLSGSLGEANSLFSVLESRSKNNIE